MATDTVSRVRHSVAYDADEIVIGAGGLECTLAEIDSDDLVTVLSVTTAAIGIVQLGARINLCLRITVLLGQNRRPQRQDCS